MELTPFAEQVFRLYLSVELDATSNQLTEEQKQKIITESLSYLADKNNISDVEKYISDSISYLNLINEIKQVFSETPPKIIPIVNDNIMESKCKRSPKWTKKEDLRLLCGTAKYGAKNWKAISAFVGYNRTSIQCNQRWNRSVNPEILHSKWTPQEDKILLETVDVKKNKQMEASFQSYTRAD
ncbi:Myb-like DNA-binding domain containing protein [Histomonas meleagridis]|uniref:Myb-like DNA-binding domain containing protein n=1 Tax=Histomonas meleagridis TaxID=135588 RepID=UPI00355A1901|nr:Myb-like DNA-binding domain containing protein [Histomonas meleagridis]KAH0799680.1 Myb-like DNA-binding domain containing protein [Histomonas meleagridis]